MERVEFLLGPQGTLYGAGTLGGAIRYIPRRPQLGVIEGEVRADLWNYSEGKGISTDTGMTINLPIGSAFAFRGSIDYMNDRGFIDYPYAVQTVGVSNPDADPTDPTAVAANFKRLKDVNTDDTISARAALRFNPSPVFDATLSYYYQEQNTDGRQFSSYRLTNFPGTIGRYESALRVPEPNSRETQLVALEAEVDLGFARLVSATGYSHYDDIGNRDQTDLLIGLEYSYEAFPNFTAFTEETGSEETWTQEVRLVSQFEGPFSFIVGGFYNKQESDGQSIEYTPGYDAFAVAEFGGVQLRPDSIEYYSISRVDLRELAAYGEATFQITPKWQVTGGIRYYDYDLKTQDAVDLPLYETVFGGRAPDSLEFSFEDGGQKNNGFLFKFNTSYQFAPRVLVYATVSEGYRIGNSNGVAPCPDPLPPNQIACALPNEQFYVPDKTINYELGFKTQFWDRRITLNGAVFYIDWKDPQIDSATQNALIPITVNGAGAKSQGVELYLAAQVTTGLSFRATYSYTNAELTDLSPNLIPNITPPGFQSTITYEDGQPGDRLPGSPEHQGSFYVNYEMPVTSRWSLTGTYGVYLQSDVLQRTGGRGGGLTLPGFDLHSAQLRLESTDGWSVAVYGENLFNEFAETGVRGTPGYDQQAVDINGDPVYVRTFGTFVAPPRRVGLRVSKRF